MARRVDVADAEIAANKRAIDGYNQNRNDAIDGSTRRCSRASRTSPRAPGAWHNSESAGAMIDRLSILALKTFHMGCEATRADATRRAASSWATISHASPATRDLARCLDTLLGEARRGRAFWRVYRQFKMYNDADLNPYLRRR